MQAPASSRRSSTLSRVVLIVWVASFTPWIIESRANGITNSSASVAHRGYIHRCYKDDLDFSDCVVKTMYDIRERMVFGIPELGMPPIEPLSLVDVDPPFEVAGLRIGVKNITASGASNITVISAKGSLEAGRFEIVANLDRALVSGDYQLTSAVPLVEFTFDGKITGTIIDATYLIDFQTEVVTREDVEFLRIVSLDLRMNIGDIVGTLWLGGQRLHVVNSLLNLPFNTLVVNRALTSTLEPIFGAVVMDHANRLLSAFPYDTLIPDTRPIATERHLILL